MKRKGFTLIELLTVIIILAIIALIAVPLILGVIEKARKQAFKDSVLNTFSQLEYYLVENNLSSLPEEGIDVSKINLKENIFTSGTFAKNDQGEIEVLNISDGNYCGIGKLTDLKIYEGACEVTNPSCYLKIEGKEASETGWYTENPKVIMTTSKALAGGLTYGIGTEENYEYEVKAGKIGKAEYQTNKTGKEKVYCYVKNVAEEKGSNEIEVKIDKTAPTEANLSYTTTSKSITVIASGTDLESGILKYQFSKDNGENWTEIQNSNVYVYDNLSSGTYPIKVRVYNGTYIESKKENNLSKESETKEISPNVLEVPSYEIDPEGYTIGEVKVKVNYGEGSIRLIKTTIGVRSEVEAKKCSSVINGAYTCEGEPTTTIEADAWYLVEEDPTLIFSDNGIIIAQAVDGVNYKSGGSYTIGNIDKEEPKIELSVSGKNVTIKLTDDKEVAGYQVTESEEVPSEWISVSGTEVVKTWTGSKAGTYYVHVKDGAGRNVKATFTLVQTAFCAYSPGQVWNFDYTGGVQGWTVPCSGTYKLEVWGAQGGNTDSASWSSDSWTKHSGGYGGYSYGNKVLSANVPIYIAVGGQPGTNIITGGYNGGGTGNGNGSGGGGATHITISNNRGVLSNYNSYRSEILIVAGGGGGSVSRYDGEIRGGNGGSGGGTTGGCGLQWIAESEIYSCYAGGTGGTQSSTGTNIDSSGRGGFGYGGNSSGSDSGGGGGGFFGGGGAGYYSAGGGGSGYIGGVTGGSMSNGARSGNGYARITLVSLSE